MSRRPLRKASRRATPRQLREPLAARREYRRLGAHHARHGCHPHAAVPARQLHALPHPRVAPVSQATRHALNPRPALNPAVQRSRPLAVAVTAEMPTGRNTTGLVPQSEERHRTSLAPQSEEAGPHQLRGAIGRAPPPCSARRRTSFAAQSEDAPPKSVAALHGSCGEPDSWRKTRRAPSSRITALSCNRQRTNCRSLNTKDRDRQSERRPSRPALNLSVTALQGVTREGHYNPAPKRGAGSPWPTRFVLQMVSLRGMETAVRQGPRQPRPENTGLGFHAPCYRPAVEPFAPRAAEAPAPQIRGACASRHPPVVCRPEYKSA